MSYQHPFNRDEYLSRIGRVKSSMIEAGLDMLVCQDPANMCYLSGFDGWSFYTPQCLLVHVDEDMPIWFGRPQDAKSALITTILHTTIPPGRTPIWLLVFQMQISWTAGSL